MLTKEDAIKIYEIKITWKTELCKGKPCQSLRGQSGPVSKLFGVSSRTVRDIWNRQTWAHATNILWSSEQDMDKKATNNSLASVIDFKVSNRNHTI